MNIELYLAFVLATTVLIIVPGPNVILIVANSLAYGPRRALLTVTGTQCAQAIQLAVVALGMTSLMLLLAGWFEWLRWLGVAYLLWLGVQRWRAEPIDTAQGPAAPASSRRLYWQGFLVALSNPKVLFFHAAFFPQFVDPAGNVGLQLGVLCTTFLVIAMVLDGGYALLAGRLRGWLASRSRMRICDRVAGSLLIGAGLWLAAARRA